MNNRKNTITKLYTPGPTPIPEQVAIKMNQNIIHHRTPEFKKLFQRLEKKLRYIFQTENNVIVLTSSGSGAMEAAVSNLFNYKNRVLTIEEGKFGQRWGEICEAFRIPVTRHQTEWGKTISPEDLGKILKTEKKYDAVFLTHNETSTGMAINLSVLAEVMQKHSQALIIVDGISSVGALPLRMDEWGLYIVISASQKGFMCPPGLAFVACSKRAEQAIQKSDQCRYYFDLRKAIKSMEDNYTPFTPATTLLTGLDQALEMMYEEGVENIWKRHNRLANAVRKTIISLGLKLFALQPSDALTAVKIPESLKSSTIVQKLKNRGYIIAGGQGTLKDKIIRIAHLGYYEYQEFMNFLGAFEAVLIESGWDCKPGQAVQIFRREFYS